MIRDLLTLAIIGGPVAWALLAYLAVFFGVAVYGFVACVLSLIKGAA